MLSASPWSCVTNTKVMPRRCCRPLSSACISSRSFRSSAPSGSSSSSTFGWLISARASATRCFCPPESWVGRRSPKLAELHQLEHLQRALAALGGADAAYAQPVGDVLRHRHVREQRVVLEDRVDVAVVRRDVGDVLAVEQDAARGPDGRSPRSGAGRWSCPSPTGPSSAKNSPGAIVERDAVERDDGAERAAHVPQFDGGFHGIEKRRPWAAPLC